MKIINYIKKKVFYETKELIIRNPKSIFKILVFDMLFFLCLQLILFVANSVIRFQNNLADSTMALVLYGLFFLAYITVFCLIYSFFKFLVLKEVKLFFTKRNLGFDRLKSFYFMNLAFFVSFLVVLFLIAWISESSVQENMLTFVLKIIFLILIISGYFFISVTHSLFAEISKMKGVLKKSFRLVFKVNKYYGVIVTSVLWFVFYYLIMYALYKTIGQSMASNLAVEQYNAFTIVMSILTVVIFYFLILFNRIYFYGIVRREK